MFEQALREEIYSSNAYRSLIAMIEAWHAPAKKPRADLPTFAPEELASETWRPVPGYGGRYEASTLGRVRRNPKVYGKKYRACEPTIAVSVHPLGYLRTRIMGDDGKFRNIGVHQVIARAFIGLCPEGREVNHKDLDKTNNRPGNLEYVTHHDNLVHAHANKTYRRDLTKPFGLGKLTAADVVAVRKLIREGLTLREIGRRFGVSGSAISAIKSGKSWRCLPDDWSAA